MRSDARLRAARGLRFGGKAQTRFYAPIEFGSYSLFMLRHLLGAFLVTLSGSVSLASSVDKPIGRAQFHSL